MVQKVLNVAEKNDAAKHIAEIMSRGGYNRRDGLSPYNKIYEFQQQVEGTQSNMVMTSVSGHLLGMDFSEQYKKWYSCHPVQLFDLPVVKSCREDSMVKIKRTLEREVRGARLLIIWTDCDREGENIGMEVVSVCRAVSPTLRVVRAKFSEITRTSIERAMRTLVPMAENVSAAVDCRQELDLRIGAAFTRFQTMRLQKIFPNSLSDKLISYGSCQFPTMGFVVERYKAIENFVSENFWKLRVTHLVQNCSVDFNWRRVRLFHQGAVEVYHAICLEDPTARVEGCEEKEKTKWRPLPLDTVELEKLASRKLRLSAKTTMSIAEKLYTQGLISYPRTETNIFPTELNLSPLVEAQRTDGRWGGFAERVLTTWGGPSPRRGKKSDQAHPPIHPIKQASHLTGDEARVYEFIVRHFLACVSRDAKGAETTVNININGERFSSSGLSIKERNYLEVYIYDKWSDKEIPNYRDVREFQPTSIDIVHGNTEPPRLLTEADLIALMDKHGIGTDATHAEHIETVKSREYVFTEDRDKLVPGKLAMALVEGYDAMGFAMSKPDLRAGLETDLVEICEGRKTKEEVLAAQLVKYKAVFETAVQNVAQLDAATQHFLEEVPTAGADDGPGGGLGGGGEPVVSCSLCTAQLALKTKQTGGWMISCQGYPACRAAPLWLPSYVKEVTVSDETCRTCPHNPSKLRLVVSRGAMSPYHPDTGIYCLAGCDPVITFLQVERLNSGRLAQPGQAREDRAGGGPGVARGGRPTGGPAGRPRGNDHGGRGGGRGGKQPKET